LQDLNWRDTGLYECRLHYGSTAKPEATTSTKSDNETVTLNVFALSVTGEVPTLFARLGDPLELNCHAFHLAKVLRAAEFTMATDPILGCKPPTGCQAPNLTDKLTYKLVLFYPLLVFWGILQKSGFKWHCL
jgi:hypothetical protein